MRRRKRIEASSHAGTTPEQLDEPVPYALTPLAVAWLERDYATRDRMRHAEGICPEPDGAA